MWLSRRNLWIPALFLLLSSLQPAASESVTPSYDDCAPQRCGHQVVSYPFWIIDHQPSYCGPPGFALTCRNDTGVLFLTVLNINLYVLRIFYSNSSIHFTLGDANDSCTFLLSRNTTGVFPFSASDSNKHIFFLFNCSESDSAIPRSYQNMSCPRFNTRVLFGGEYDPVRTRSPDPNCTVGVLPVMGDSNISAGSNYSALLLAGWMASYTAKSCSKCAASGGRCGFDANNTSTSQGSICICPNGVHLGSCSRIPGNQKRSLVIILTVGTTALLLFGITCYFTWVRHMRLGKTRRLRELRAPDDTIGSDKEVINAPLVDFFSIHKATDNFAATNKLGEGGFGSVYKGRLEDGQYIAVKRLSENSKQGFEELKNEVKLIVRLQHTNLVRLLGWCVHENEKILIYEYMPNKSLDKYLFDSNLSVQLDWHKRFCIIQGIAQGLLYLHRYSRLRVIHRDLKTSNILLDENMNPKISDFGLARIFGESHMEQNTRRLVGTYGYMAPEYGLNGRFSEKSDVYSFGVIMLEIISSKRNSGSYSMNDSFSLLGYAWHLWAEGRCCELIDPQLIDSFPVFEVEKCIQVGLLCVQDRSTDRPTMDAITIMLVNKNPVLPSPQQPAYTYRTDSPTLMPIPYSQPPELTMSTIEGR
ncbi:receptor-like serine/threonine-protein kinase SD1-7 [Zingiber officinale]|uniref:receptor-like serine/threonine-protein kinase SD1-7 n=1 Tax=Zingiber officinale TaxID=94328 RepID=UPI001C4CA905|nr:receptor-like serine/threonine-protein kinase SD1-7 [Zingiber officinale]